MRKVKCTIGAVFLLGFQGIALAETGPEKSWTEKTYCQTYQAPTLPKAINKNQLQIIGVAINRDGELIRLSPKTKTLNQLPTTIDIAAHSNWFEGLNRKDFQPAKVKYTGMETPLDAGSTINEAASFAYVLLPSSWEFTSDIAFSLKDNTRGDTYPYLSFADKALNSKTALLHRGQQYLSDTQSCNYQFNLHVTIVQYIEGVELRTPIIIDPGMDNDEVIIR